jgi:hypothetical protein
VAEILTGHSMLTAYNALAVRAWEDPGARRRFAEAPRDALAAYGWEVPPDTRVAIEFVEAGSGARGLGPEQIVAHWRHGLEGGDLRIKIPAEPPAAELSGDESAEISAGDYAAPRIYPV